MKIRHALKLIQVHLRNHFEKAFREHNLLKSNQADPSKINAITEMPPPKTDRQIRRFLKHVQFISRFILKLTIACKGILKKLRKTSYIKWGELCQKGFNAIKE